MKYLKEIPEQLRTASIVVWLRVWAALIFVAGTAGIVYVIADEQEPSGRLVVSVLLQVGTPVIFTTALLAVASVFVELIARGIDEMRREEFYGPEEEGEDRAE